MKRTFLCQDVKELESFEQVTTQVEAVHAVFVALFDKRFGKMHIDLVWVSLLNPQLARMTHLREDDVERARMRFLSAAA